jgi:hypothetical protein
VLPWPPPILHAAAALLRCDGHFLPFLSVPSVVIAATHYDCSGGMPELYWRYGYLYLWLILIGIIIVVVFLYMLIGVIPNPFPSKPKKRRAQKRAQAQQADEAGRRQSITGKDGTV